MKIKIFESDCGCVSKYKDTLQKKIQEEGIEAEILTENDLMELVKNNILQPPAISVNGRIVMMGRLPEYNEVIRIIKEEV